MTDDKKKPYDYVWHSSITNAGTLSLELYFPDKKATKEQKITALAESLRQNRDTMLSRGYLTPESRFMSPRDVAQEYGHTRQYWEKLLNEGKIPFKETSAGRITTDLWVQGYLNNKEDVDRYIRDRNKIVAATQDNAKKHGRIACPNCGEVQFDYNVNYQNINGLCRAGCGFRVNTTF